MKNSCCFDPIDGMMECCENGCRQVGDKDTAVAYKSAERGELEKAGYRILGNMGDQWSDLLGTHVGNRTFKVKQAGESANQ
ncbi:hypothetical protein RJ639_003539 [Escallonia herrerae]|uniref:Uncharacterized protein n=1 Tax=Escallonia herrerae TaxID=1293975 RepID=A0AA88W1H3_9ASTE|nr:hypothetical protein RJ639_003539 [Escallonia herrerae]